MFSRLKKFFGTAFEPSAESVQSDNGQNTDALRAVESESASDVDRLVQSGFDAPTLLALSLQQNKRKIAEFLIGKGVRLTLDKADALFTLLVGQALVAGDMSILDLGFRAGFDIHRRFANGYTPLEYAIHGKWPNLIEFLVALGATYSDIHPHFWFTRCFRGPGMMINKLVELGLDVPADVRAWGDVFKAEEATRSELPKRLGE